MRSYSPYSHQRYPDDEYEEHERLSFTDPNYVKGSYVVDPQSSAHRPCRHTFRPKYVCTECRRAYKMHVHPDNEYYCKEYSNRYYWRPKVDRGKVYDAYRKLRKERPADFAKFESFFYGPPDYKNFSREEIDQFKEIYPWVWEPLEELRCPGCGKPGQPVGTAFRAPAADDTKAWQEIERLLSEGERFLPCPSVEEYEEMLIEGRRMMLREMQAEEWQKEKRRRIESLTKVESETDSKSS